MRSIYAVVYTPGLHEVLPTKKACRERMKAWKEYRESIGVKVRSVLGGEAYMTDSEAIVLHEYDAQTKERIVKLPPLKPVAKPDPKPSQQPKKRRGRRPVGV